MSKQRGGARGGGRGGGGHYDGFKRSQSSKYDQQQQQQQHAKFTDVTWSDAVKARGKAGAGGGRADENQVPATAPPTQPASSSGADATAANKLSAQQQFIYEAVVTRGESLFFTGAAGAGKSFLLRHVIDALKRKYKQQRDSLAVTASTGIAAVNIRGQTLHSWAGIGLGKDKAETLAMRIAQDPKRRDRWQACRVLIIDEVSMVSRGLFEQLEEIARLVRNTDQPFGGIQLVFCGDFFQLPPVNKGGGGFTSSSTNPNTFCFQSSRWRSAIPRCYMMTQVFRQRDPRFVQVLNEMRMNRLSRESVEIIRSLERPLVFDDGIEPTELYALRSQVDNSNGGKLARLSGELVVFEAEDHVHNARSQQHQQSLQSKLDSFMAPKKLQLKVGAQVMLLANLETAGGLCNGSMGIVRDFSEENNTVYPVVHFPSANRTILIRHHEWKWEENGREVASRSQIPLLLAWAMSIHKSQGQTIERLRIDLGKSFECGMSYVALSRGVSLETVQVVNFSEAKVKTHQLVVDFAATNLIEVPGGHDKLESNVNTAQKAAPPSTQNSMIVLEDDDGCIVIESSSSPVAKPSSSLVRLPAAPDSDDEWQQAVARALAERQAKRPKTNSNSKKSLFKKK